MKRYEKKAPGRVKCDINRALLENIVKVSIRRELEDERTALGKNALRKGGSTVALLRDMTLGGFTDELAADSAAPGGGSVAALSGALGAALVSMVCRLTIGKKGYEEYELEVKDALAESEVLRKRLLEAIDIDAKAFEKVMEAFAAPKSTDEEKAARREMIQTAFKGACESPRRTAADCLEVLRLCARVADKTNTNAASDLGVGASNALAALESAAMNVLINLPSIKDDEYVDDLRDEMEAIQEEGGILRAGVLREVSAHIGGN